MIQRLTNLNGLTVETNYLHPSEPTLGNYNIGEINHLSMDDGLLLIKISGITYSYIDEIAKMKLILPISGFSDGTRFFAREVTTSYTPSSVNWNTKPSVNTSQIEAEHFVEILGSGLTSPTAQAVVLDLTNLARKWKESGTSNRSIAIYTTGTWGYIYTPRYSSILNTEQVLVIENARQTGLASHLSFTEQEIGFAGKSFINNFTGKLLAAFSGFSTDSQKAPISFGAFYAQQRPVGISPLSYKKTMPYYWRSNFDYGVSQTTKRFTIVYPDGSVQHYDEVTPEQAAQYNIATTLDKVYINFFDFSYLEDQGDLVIYDQQKNQMKLSKTGLIKEVKKTDGSTITYVNDGSRIVSINADGKTVALTYLSGYVQRVEFIEEEKSIFITYGTYGPTSIKLQDITYVTEDTSSGGTTSTKTYVDRYEAKYEYSGSTLIRMIDVKMNLAMKFTFTSSKVTKITNQVYSPLTDGAYIDIDYDTTRAHTKITDYQDNITYLYKNNYGQCIQKVDGDGNAIAMRYANVSEDGTQQKLQEASSAIYNVRNMILNHSFDSAVEPIDSDALGWKTNAPLTVKVVDGGVYGDQCIRVRRENAGVSIINQTIEPPVGNHKIVFFAKSKDAVGTAKVKAVLNYSIRRLALPGEIGILDPDGNAYVIVDADTINVESSNIVGIEDWTRFEVSGLNIPSTATSTSLEIKMDCSHSEGDVFFDDFQLVAPQRSTYNLIQNGFFDGETGSIPVGWTASSENTSSDRLVSSSLVEPFDTILGANNMMFVGAYDKLKSISRHLDISGGAGEEFSLISWAKGYVLDSDIFRVKMLIEYPEFENEELFFDFGKDTTNWQMLLRNITTSKPYSGMTITLEHQGPNTVNFDSVQLYRDASGKHYNYDEKGNLLDQMTSDKTKSSLSYDDSNKISQSVDPSGDTYKYTYNEDDKLTKIKDAKGNEILFEYDTNGNRTKSEIKYKEDSGLLKSMVFEQAFNSDNKVESTTDELGNTSSILYDAKGRVYKETNAKNVIKTSSYDAYDNLIQLIQSKDGKSTAHTYQYNTDQSLKSITTDNGTKYDFVYDAWGKLKQVKVNNVLFASYEHDFVKHGVETDLVTKQIYGSDSTEAFDFSYDQKGRLEEVNFKGGLVAQYEYNDKGQVFHIHTPEVEKYFSYDVKGKLVKESNSEGKIIRFDYDNLDQVQKATFDINGVMRSYDFEYTNEFNQYNRDGLRTRITKAFKDDVAEDNFSYRGIYGMSTSLISNAYFLEDNLLSERALTLTKNTSQVVYDLSTVNNKRTTGMVDGEWFDKINWRNRFYYNKSFMGWFRPYQLTDERAIMTVGKDGNDYFKVLGRKDGTNYVFTLKYTKDGANSTKATLTVPAVDKWMFIGLTINKAESNTELRFAVEDQYAYSFMSSFSVTHLINQAVIGDRSQPSVGSDEPNSTYQLKSHMFSIGAYIHTKDTFGILHAQGEKYLTNDPDMTPKTGVSFENPEIYDGLDTVSLNGTFISKQGVRPKSYAYTDKSYALDKTRLFEYSNDDDKHVYGSYDGLMGLADTKGKLIYDFDLKSKGSMSIRFKPVVSSTTDRTIIMYKKDGVNLFGVRLKTDNKLYMVLNGTDYVVGTTTYAYDAWKTVILTWDGSTFKVNNGVTTKTLTASISLKDAMTIIGSDLATDGFTPEKHLNGQLEMLAYKDDVIDTTTVTKLFQNNHVLSVKTYVDILGRSKKDVIDTGLVELENSYSYKAPASGKTSLQVESIQKYDNTTVTYDYDELGNITSMVTPDGTYEYEYDYLNRLVREYNPKVQKTMIMVYKTNNNIEFKKYYNGNQPLTVSSTPIESYEYKYENSWKDQLTSIVKSSNGVVASTETISYDGSNFIGNPSSIGDKNLTWSGRKLTKITEANKDTIEYFYNEEGIRTKKKVGTDITTYELNGSNIISETKNGTETVRYIYNERGLLVGFEHLSKVYYYVRDLHGIITEVVDENGSVMVSYKYDAWGKIIDKEYTPNTIGEDIALLNHFVYKGYYLDNETEWYYLETRYYDCHTSRYISSDSNLGKVGEYEGLNAFAYAHNNPVNLVDEDGKWPKWVKNVLIGVAIIAAVAVVTALVVTSGGTAAPLIPAIWSAAQTGLTMAAIAGGVSGAIRVGRSLDKNIKEGNDLKTILKNAGKSFLAGFGDGFLAGAEYYATVQVFSLLSYNISGALNNGYGFSSGSFEFGYQLPSKIGIAIMSFSLGKKFRIESDMIDQLHYHFGTGKEGRKHKGKWIGPVVVGIVAGFSGEVY